jgi:hypothetical protein
MKLTYEERSVLIGLIHGAQDDDDAKDPHYSATLASLMRKVRKDRVMA